MKAYEYMSLVLALIALLPAAYYYLIFGRIVKTIGLKVKKPVFIIVNILLCLIVWYFMCPLLTSAALALYMIAMIDISLLIVDLILKKVTKKTNEEAGRRVWKCIYGYCLIPLCFVIYSFVYGGIHIRDIVQTDFVVTTPKNITEEGFRVCFLSDVHCGNALSDKDYENICRRIDAQDVDIVILGGDLVDFNTLEEEAESLLASLGSIKNRAGIYYIFGNHDRLADYKNSTFSEEYIIDLCEKNGITVLQDEWVEFGNGICLIGREDADTKYGRERKSEEEVFKHIDRDEFILVADHQPCNFKELANLGTDLALSGHLHAGQILPFSLILPFTNDEHVTWGRYLITQKRNCERDNDGPANEGDGTATAIVSAGLVGWNYPIRTSGISEYCIIDIVKEK